MKTITVIGNDARQNALREKFADCLVPPEQADAAVLPMPATADAELIRALKPGAVVIGGRIENAELFAPHRVYDYAKRDDFAILNAVATAEAAIALVMERLKITLDGAEILVIGNGRIGKILARKLALLGADVTVSARKSADLAEIETAGHKAVHTREIYLSSSRFDAVVNTVPAAVIDSRFLENMRPGAFIIDVASAPGGTDFDAAEKLGIYAVNALALPGKYSPVSAAEYAYRSIRNILSEVEENGD